MTPGGNEMPVKGAWRVHVALILVQVGFGSLPVAGKLLLAHMPPLALAALRVAGATPLLLALAWLVERRLPGRRDLPILALLGLLGVAANQLLFITGLNYTTAVNASILMPSIPVFAVGIAILLKKERATRGRLLGVGLAVSGALVMLNPARLSFNADLLLGNLLIISNCLAYALYLVLQRPLLERLPPLTVTAWAFVFGGLVVAAVGGPDLARVSWANLPEAGRLTAAYIVLIPTVATYSVNMWAVRHSSSTLAATYVTLQPLVAALLAAYVLNERLGVTEALGFALIAAGLSVVHRRSSRG